MRVRGVEVYNVRVNVPLHTGGTYATMQLRPLWLHRLLLYVAAWCVLTITSKGRLTCTWQVFTGEGRGDCRYKTMHKQEGDEGLGRDIGNRVTIGPVEGSR